MRQWRILKSLLCSVCLAGFAGAGIAQQAPAVRLGAPQVAVQPQQPGGTITGHVYCGDTQRPARFADVEVLRPPDASSQGQGGRGTSYAAVARGRTALDGSFMITAVPAGDYYVSAVMTGYVNPAAVARMTQAPILGVPMTHVDVNGSANVMVSMERGAVVSGRVAYDDGSPLPGVSVRLRPIASGGSGDGQLGAFNGTIGGLGFIGGFGGDMGYGQTDDRGVFRLSGVPPGKYNVMTTVPTEMTGRGQARGGGLTGIPPMLSVYAPASMHKTDARVLEIRGGETVDGVDIVVALNGLRTVKGSVEAKADGHMLNSGIVSLADAADSSLSRTAGIESDGSFRVEYLPPGTYTLSVMGQDRSQDSGGGRGGNRGGTTKRYERGTATVTVGDHDVTVDTVQLDEVKSSTTASTPGR